MVGLLIAVIVIVIICALIFLAKHQPQKSSMSYPYVKQNALFSPGEKLFLDALEKAVGGQYKIFGKVRMTDIMEVKKNLTASERKSAWNRISSKHMDFVLCDVDASFVCGIELDDKSHNQAKQAKNDNFKDEAFKAISLPLIRFEQRRGYDTEKIQNQILQILESGRSAVRK